MLKYSLNGKPMDLDGLVAAVKKYRDDLPEKAKQVRRRVAQEMADLMESNFGGAWYDDVLGEGMSVPAVEVFFEDRGDIHVVVASGDSVVWQEFGAGVTYNGAAGSSPHPWAGRNAFYIGTYGKGLGARKVWGYYDPPYQRDREHLKQTYGTPASMPMYHAAEDVKQRIAEIAREVFEGDGAD